jgi:hypothetical protein
MEKCVRCDKELTAEEAMKGYLCGSCDEASFKELHEEDDTAFYFAEMNRIANEGQDDD